MPSSLAAPQIAFICPKVSFIARESLARRGIYSPLALHFESTQRMRTSERDLRVQSVMRHHRADLSRESQCTSPTAVEPPYRRTRSKEKGLADYGYKSTSERQEPGDHDR